jgi:hypothetical protein
MGKETGTRVPKRQCRIQFLVDAKRSTPGSYTAAC